MTNLEIQQLKGSLENRNRGKNRVSEQESPTAQNAKLVIPKKNSKIQDSKDLSEAIQAYRTPKPNKPGSLNGKKNP